MKCVTLATSSKDHLRFDVKSFVFLFKKVNRCPQSRPTHIQRFRSMQTSDFFRKLFHDGLKLLSLSITSVSMHVMCFVVLG